MKVFVGKTARVRASACLACGTLLDAATPVNAQRARPRRDNSVSICFSCGHVMVFDKHDRLRNPTPDELASINELPTVKATLWAIAQRKARQ